MPFLEVIPVSVINPNKEAIENTPFSMTAITLPIRTKGIFSITIELKIDKTCLLYSCSNKKERRIDTAQYQ